MTIGTTPAEGPTARGGTGILTTGTWASQVTHQNNMDYLGRWTSTTIRGKQNKYLTVISAYKPCRNPGSTTTWTLQALTMAEKGILNPQPRKQFTKDFIQFIQPFIDQEHNVIIGVDVNSARERNDDDNLFQSLEEIGLRDVFDRFEGPRPATYDRGNNQIDFMYVTNKVYENISHAGAMPFNSHVNSDHRPLYIDIDINKILGKTNHNMNLAKRKITSADPEAAKIFKECVAQQLQNHKITEKIHQLLQQTPSTKHAKEVNNIDIQIQRAIKHAEHQTRQKKKAPWSMELILSQALIEYWHMRMVEIRKRITLHKTREKLAYMNVITTEQETRQEIKRNKRRAARAYKRNLLNAKELRKQFLTKQAEAYAEANNSKAATRLHFLIHMEEKKESYQKIKYIRGQMAHRSGLKHVIVNENGTELTVDNPEDLDNTIINRNKKHFNQANNTPFATKPITETIGREGNNEETTQILKGNRNMDNFQTTEAAREILQYLTQQQGTNFQQEITMKNVVQGFKKWNERTSTSPSGRHLGTYKSIIAYEKEIRDITTPTEDMSPAEICIYAITNVINLTTKHHIILDRWTTITSCMLEKTPGRPIIEKLRTIHLFEADFNFLAGITWSKRLIQAQELTNNMGDETWGGRKGRGTQEPNFLKEMTFTLANLTRTSLGTFDNDAKACYDRIILNLFNMRSKQMGVLPAISDTITTHIHNAKYNIKTANGISQQTYHNTLENPLHGIGQGGRHSSTAWLIISTMLIKLMEKKSQGVIFTGTRTKTKVQRRMDAFVDDCTKFINEFEAEMKRQPTQILTKLQQAAQWWEQLLHASGGKLELTKCFYYMVEWGFDENGFAHIIQDETRQPITIKDSETGEQIQIQEKQARESHRTLGYHINPQLDTEPSFQHLKLKASKLAGDITKHYLSPMDTELFARAIYKPSITYTLLFTYLTDLELQEIERAPLSKIIQRLGFNRSFPRAVVHAPKHHGGLGIIKLTNIQQKDKITFVLKHARNTTTIAKWLETTMDWQQLHAGTTYCIFKQPQTQLLYLQKNWLTELRRALANTNCKLHLTFTKPTKLRRIHDAAIMEIGVDMRLTRLELQRLNACRLYLRVETIADISNTQGTEIQEEVWDKSIRQPKSWPTIPWPIQTKPGEIAWNVWQRMINHVSHSRLLYQNLGNWIDVTNRQWPAAYNPITNNIIISNSKDSMAIKAKTHRSTIHGILNKVTKLPDPKHNIPIDWNGHSARFPSPLNQPTEPTTIQTFHDYISVKTEEWEKDLLKNYTIADYPKLKQAIETSIITVNDGGANAEQTIGSFGWVIATDKEVLAHGGGYTRGSPISSFRAEAYGRMAVLTFVIHFAKYYNANFKTATMINYCDNLSLLQRQKQFNKEGVRTPGNFIKNDIDTTITLRNIQTNIPNMTYLHVKGHQDNTTPIPWPAQLNIQADAIATEYLQQQNDVADMILLQPCKAYLQICNTIKTGDELEILNEKAAIQEHQKYMCEKLQWHPNQYQSVNWKSIKTTIKNVSSTCHRMIIKMVTGWLPTNHINHRQSHTTDKCSRCNEIETNLHLFHCPRRQEWREKFIVDLENTLQQAGTAPENQQSIVDSITAFIHQRPINATNDQAQLGGKATMMGLFHKSTIQLQTEHNQMAQTKTRGETWAHKIRLKLWQQLFLLWKDRCKHNHEFHDETNTPVRQAILQRIKHIYDNKQALTQHHQLLITPSFEERSREKTKHLKIWLIAAERAFKTQLPPNTSTEDNDNLHTPTTSNTVPKNKKNRNYDTTNQKTAISTIQSNSTKQKQVPTVQKTTEENKNEQSSTKTKVTLKKTVQKDYGARSKSTTKSILKKKEKQPITTGKNPSINN